MAHLHHHEHHSTICHQHHGQINEKSVTYLLISFVINMLLSVVEIIGGIIAGSVALIGDALHNTSDAFSILIAVIAFKIGHHKASKKYTYGFKRAEVIGGFVNLILLFISGLYLAFEGVERLIFPKPIEGLLIIVISVFALIIDLVTAKISHHGAHHNSNMKMVFVHNLADAFGSLGVILSGICVVLFNVYFIDGIIALFIAAYMIFQSVVSFKPIVNILMNAAPEHLDLNKIQQAIENIKGIKDVHHIHVWCISENDISLECHIKGTDLDLVDKVHDLLSDEFHITHANIQLENVSNCPECEL
ncbi:MAG: cation transporter [Alphaproteobacteria bacterium]|nr:cation transporter [Alphaproteobacteria bacterium]